MIKYKNKEIYEVTIASTLSQYKGSHIDNDIVLFDNLAQIPFPDRTRRMQCMMAALCLNGRATYRLDTIEHTVERNDVIIITNGMVVDNCSFSEDFSGIGFIISPNFFSDIAKDVHEISSLFLFARSNPVSTLSMKEADTFCDYYKMLKSKIDCVGHHFRRDVARMTSPR